MGDVPEPMTTCHACRGIGYIHEGSCARYLGCMGSCSCLRPPEPCPVCRGRARIWWGIAWWVLLGLAIGGTLAFWLS